MLRPRRIGAPAAEQVAEPHVFDQTNGTIQLPIEEFEEPEDPRNVKRRESSEQAMAFLWGGKY